MRLAGALSPLRSEAGAWRSPWRRMRSAFSGALRPAAAAASGLTLPLLPPVADLELGSPRELRLNNDRFAAGAQPRRPSLPVSALCLPWCDAGVTLPLLRAACCKSQQAGRATNVRLKRPTSTCVMLRLCCSGYTLPAADTATIGDSTALSNTFVQFTA